MLCKHKACTSCMHGALDSISGISIRAELVLQATIVADKQRWLTSSKPKHKIPRHHDCRAVSNFSTVSIDGSLSE